MATSQTKDQKKTETRLIELKIMDSKVMQVRTSRTMCQSIMENSSHQDKIRRSRYSSLYRCFKTYSRDSRQSLKAK